MTDVLVTGGTGQMGRALAQFLPRARFVARSELDLSQLETIEPFLARVAPRVVINTAAFTQVDLAESQKEMAFRVNGEAVKRLAHWCAANKVPLIHFSTDYVYSGKGEQPWHETDDVRPLNVYGESKRAGEIAILEAGGSHLIIRTSWVYDAFGRNFFNAILRLARERDSLSIVSDQRGAPTYAPHLAQAIAKILEQVQTSALFAGVYHLAGSGETSWYEFAEKIVQGAKQLGWPIHCNEIKAISTAEYPTPAQRPLNSRLNCGKFLQSFGIQLPSWQEGLKECLQVKYESERFKNSGFEAH